MPSALKNKKRPAPTPAPSGALSGLFGAAAVESEAATAEAAAVGKKGLGHVAVNIAGASRTACCCCLVLLTGDA
jgi:hypothetical protein